MSAVLPIATMAGGESSHTWDISAAPLVAGGLAHVIHNGLEVYPSTITTPSGSVAYAPSEPFSAGDAVWGWYDDSVATIQPGTPVRAPIRDRVTALSKLSAMCAPGVSPQLSNDELDELLDNRQVASVWMPATLYVVGQRVAPSVPNGRLYRCVANPYVEWGPEYGGGTSGAVEPSWQGVSAWPRLGLRGQSDGDDGLFWAEDGPEGRGLWDIRGAAHDAWLLKAAKSSACVDMSAGKISREQSQVHAHCIEMAGRYKALRIS